MSFFCKLVRELFPIPSTSNGVKTCYYDGKKLLEGGKIEQEEITKCMSCVNKGINSPDEFLSWKIQGEILAAFYGDETQHMYRTVVRGQGITAQYKDKEVIRILNSNPTRMYHAELYCRDKK